MVVLQSIAAVIHYRKRLDESDNPIDDLEKEYQNPLLNESQIPEIKDSFIIKEPIDSTNIQAVPEIVKPKRGRKKK